MYAAILLVICQPPLVSFPPLTTFPPLQSAGNAEAVTPTPTPMPPTPATKTKSFKPGLVYGYDGEAVSAASADRPIVIQFSAPWCVPCKRVFTDLSALTTKMDTQLHYVDIDKHKSLATSYGITTIPRLWVVDRGKIIYDKTGSDLGEVAKYLIRRAP